MPDRDQPFAADLDRLPPAAQDAHAEGDESLADRAVVLPPVVVAEDRQGRDVPLERGEHVDPVEVRRPVNDVAAQDEEIGRRLGGAATDDGFEELAAGRAVKVQVAQVEDREPVPRRR
ncbi:MAG TPA: hypothetical protein VM597_38530 [Gemmataceae bacterium]|nr:hypothetical protein [Gemmataceae bacterium]